MIINKAAKPPYWYSIKYFCCVGRNIFSKGVIYGNLYSPSFVLYLLFQFEWISSSFIIYFRSSKNQFNTKSSLLSFTKQMLFALNMNKDFLSNILSKLFVYYVRYIYSMFGDRSKTISTSIAFLSLRAASCNISGLRMQNLLTRHIS